MAFLVCAFPSTVLGAERYALVVTGASGGPQYAQKYDGWRTSFVTTLRETLRYPDDHVLILAELKEAGVREANRENVRAALDNLRKRVMKDDVVLILLIGHGTGIEADDAKFNLVGPDLSADDWAALVKPIAARVVFVNTTGGSFAFLHALSGRDRIVLTATDSAAQQFDTVFPDLFIGAFRGDEADGDKNGRVSIWEAFSHASAGVGAWFDQRGQLATERPLLDDTGDGVGREAETAGPDGAIARVTYIAPDGRIPLTDDADLARLLTRRAAAQAEFEVLKARKGQLPPEAYEAALEKILLELARIDRQIRSRT